MSLTARASGLDENKYGMEENKMHGKSGVAGARRALGDIGNFVGGLTSRMSGKDQGLKSGALTERSSSSILGGFTKRSSGVSTRSRAAGKEDATTSAKLRNVADSALAPSRSRHAAPQDDLPDIDAADRHDPLAATEYINDIHAYYRRVETKEAVRANYMSDQADVNDKMRAILIDWLVEVHLKFKLMPETLFLTVNLIDRYLAKKAVTRKNLQLVGVTAMLVAAKYEEIWAPEVRDFVYISDKAYTRDQILATEKNMLNLLSFNLTVPTPYQFLSRFLKAAGADKRLEMAAFFILELALPDYQFVKYSPSHLSAAALLVAMRACGRPQWTNALNKHSGYSEAALKQCADALTAVQAKAPSGSLTAVYKKYSSSKYLEAAKIPVVQGK